MASQDLTAFSHQQHGEAGPTRSARSKVGLALCAVTLALLAGCGDDKAAAPAGAPGGGMPPA
ncbi:MAG: hypothetical protein WAV91_11165, partial [Aquabacterium sp.]